MTRSLENKKLVLLISLVLKYTIWCVFKTYKILIELKQYGSTE